MPDGKPSDLYVLFRKQVLLLTIQFKGNNNGSLIKRISARKLRKTDKSNQVTDVDQFVSTGWME